MSSQLQQHQSEITDEATYVKYAESFVFDMQRSFRNKAGVEHLAVIEMCMMLEELCFNQALKEKSILDSSIWANKECVLIYQRLCEKMLRNLESKDHYNWNAVLIDHDKNPKNVQFYITKEDDGRAKKTQYEVPYKPPKEKASRTSAASDTARSTSNVKKVKKKSSGGGGDFGSSSGGGRSKKKATPPVPRQKKAASAAGLMTATVDWMKGMTTEPTSSSSVVTAAAEEDAGAVAPTAATAAMTSDKMEGDFHLDLDLFDDPTLSMSFVHAEAAAAALSMQANEGVVGGGGGSAMDLEHQGIDVKGAGEVRPPQSNDRDLLDDMDF